MRFVSCSWAAEETAAATIGADGGTLRVAEHEIRIPAGAVSEPTQFVARVPAGTRIALTLEAVGQPELDLVRSAAVTISYARCERQDLVRRRLSVVAVPEGGAVAIASTGTTTVESTEDPLAGTLEFEAKRGTYAVAY